MINKKICIGITEDNLLVFATLNYNGSNKVKYWYKNTESFRDCFNENEGIENAREYLEDGDLWREAVKNQNTSLGLDDWAEEVLSIDGFQNVLDVYEFGDYWISWDTIGGWEEYKKSKYKHLFITKEDFENFFKKEGDINEGTKREKELISLFERYANQDDKKIAKIFREELGKVY